MKKEKISIVQNMHGVKNHDKNLPGGRLVQCKCGLVGLVEESEMTGKRAKEDFMCARCADQAGLND